MWESKKSIKSRLQQVSQQACLVNDELKSANDKIDALNRLITNLNNQNSILVQSNEQLKSDMAQISTRMAQIDVSDAQCKIVKLNKEIAEKQSSLELKQHEINRLDGEINIIKLGFIQPVFKFNTSQEYKQAIRDIKKRQRQLVKSSIYFGEPVEIDGDTTRGWNLKRGYANMAITSFNLLCDANMEKCRHSNYDEIKANINQVFSDINNNFMFGMYLKDEYLNIKLEELDLVYQHQIKLNDEKEERKRQAEIIREQKAAEEEINKAKAKLEKELKHYQLQNDDIKVAEIKEQLSSCDYRLANQRAGHLYVISNDDMIDGICKIGISRRIDPFVRVNELGGSSHAYKFNTHAMVFTEDCFKLESDLHRYFAEKRVNPKREFFYVTLDEVKSALAEFGYDVEMVENMEEVC